MQVYEQRHREQAMSAWSFDTAADLALEVRDSLPAPRFNLAMSELLNDLLFPSLWMFIGFVSSCDAYLTIKYQEQICYLESNPVGRLLLSLDGGEPGLFIGAKFLGTIMVLGFLTMLYRANRPMATLLTSALAIFQLGLLCYLFLR